MNGRRTTRSEIELKELKKLIEKGAGNKSLFKRLNKTRKTIYN